ncbi:MAG: DUF2442 domain-containing protein [Candidatus Eisenbacteria bacterium]
MNSIPLVVHAEHVSGYRVRLTFDDGVTGTVDFEPWLRGPVFEPLREVEAFRQFVLEGGTVAWPATGADIAPETLHRSALEGRAA